MERRKKHAYNELLRISDYLEGKITTSNGLQFLEIDSAVGTGQIHCISLDAGLMALEFDVSLYQDQELALDWLEEESVYLFYCLKGNCFHKFKGHEVITKLEGLQTAAAFNDDNHKSTLVFRKEERLVLNCIQIALETYEGQGDSGAVAVNKGLVTLLTSYNKKMGYLHTGKFNLEIAELIKMLERAKFADSISSLNYFHGVCHMILAKQLDQFKSDLEKGQKPTTTLLKRELEMISEIGDFIVNYPEVQHSVNSLSSKSGLSPSKLQLGFRFMHNMTLGEYIRKVRLEKAEYLIRTTDFNISEVVYSIGFTSRSYFCKIFKKKYKCSPKTYKKQTKNAIVY